MELGIGVVGGGFMGRTWSQVAGMAPGTPLRAVAGGRRAAKLAVDYGVAEEPTVDKLLARADVDIVIITSPPRAHLDQVVAAAAAGKHVLVEKPMAPDAAACRTMAAACREAGVALAVVSQHRFRNSPRAARELIESGAIGSIRMVRVTGVDHWWDMTQTADDWKLDAQQMRVFDDWGAHGCDVLCWLVGSQARHRVRAVRALQWHRSASAERDGAVRIRERGHRQRLDDLRDPQTGSRVRAAVPRHRLGGPDRPRRLRRGSTRQGTTNGRPSTASRPSIRSMPWTPSASRPIAASWRT